MSGDKKSILEILERQNCEDLYLINRLQKFGEISVRAKYKVENQSWMSVICGPSGNTAL